MPLWLGASASMLCTMGAPQSCVTRCVLICSKDGGSGRRSAPRSTGVRHRSPHCGRDALRQRVAKSSVAPVPRSWQCFCRGRGGRGVWVCFFFVVWWGGGGGFFFHEGVDACAGIFFHHVARHDIAGVCVSI